MSNMHTIKQQAEDAQSGVEMPIDAVDMNPSIEMIENSQDALMQQNSLFEASSQRPSILGTHSVSVAR